MMQNLSFILFPGDLTGERAKHWVSAKDKGNETVVWKLLIDLS
jgi:hypothetical protein